MVDQVRVPHGLVLRKPVDVQQELPVGSGILLRWKTAAGRHELKTKLAAEVYDVMPLWELDALGEPAVWQQRAFVRAADSLPVHLRQEETLCRGVVVDLSEGGARCVLRHSDGIVVAAPAELHMMLEEKQLALPGTLLSLEADEAERHIIRMQFGPLGRTSDLLRRRVMEQQRRVRALTRA